MKPTLRTFLHIGLLSVCLPGSVSVHGAETATLQVKALHGTIGGYNNAIATNSSSATIGGGDSNAIRMDAPFSTIGGGRVNSIQAGSSAATIAGGLQNTIFGGAPYAAIAGGWVNSIQTNAFYSFIGGGFANGIGGDAHASTITGGATNRIGERACNSVIAGGDENRVQQWAYDSVISGGNQNTIGTNSPFASIGGGLLNQAQAAYSTIAGGNGNHTQPGAFYGTIPGGLRAEAASFGQFAYAAGRFSANGDAQTSLYVLRQITTGPAVTELFLDGTARRMKVPVGGAWTFDILVVARSQMGATTGFQVKGVIENDRNRTRLVGAPVTTPLGAESGWKVAVEADAENEALAIKVVGQAETKIRWVANVRTVEVIY